MRQLIHSAIDTYRDALVYVFRMRKWEYRWLYKPEIIFYVPTWIDIRKNWPEH